MRKSVVRVGSMSGHARARGLSHSLAAMPGLSENGSLLFAGRLLSVGESGAASEVQIQQGAIEFLQRLADPLVVVSVHGAKVRPIVLVYAFVSKPETQSVCLCCTNCREAASRRLCGVCSRAVRTRTK